MRRWIEITPDYRCNNRCLGCFSVQDDGPSMTTREAVDELSLGLREGASSCWIGGGEPTLRRDLFTIAKAARRLGYERVRIQTNGMMLSYPDFAARAVDAGITEVSFSIKGATAEQHDKLARTPGWSAGINEAARRALHPFVAPGTWAGRKASASAWEDWALIMQLLAVRTPDQVASEIPDHHALKPWLARRAQEWADRGIDPLDWVYQSLAYDAHDVGTTPGMRGDTALALSNVRAKTLILGARPDLYNPTACAEWASRQIPGCVYAEVKSDWGHLTFSAADAENASLVRLHISQFLWASESKS